MTKEFARNGISFSIQLEENGYRDHVMKTDPVWHEEYLATIVKHKCAGRIQGLEQVVVTFDIWSPEEIEKAVAKVENALFEIADATAQKETNEQNLRDTIKRLGFRP